MWPENADPAPSPAPGSLTPHSAAFNVFKLISLARSQKKFWTLRIYLSYYTGESFIAHTEREGDEERERERSRELPQQEIALSALK